MRVERLTANTDAWRSFRAALWPEAQTHDADIARILARDDLVAFMAFADGAPAGLAEASLRRDYVNGCETSPVVFLEEIYVEPAHRKAGIARALTEAVEAWGRTQGCTEFASDALIDNIASWHMHIALGFHEAERVVYFHKKL
jgi:aminoglycoside 6'-N-acetyltransferase I